MAAARHRDEPPDDPPAEARMHAANRQRPTDERTSSAVKVSVEDDGKGRRSINARIPGWVAAAILAACGIGVGGGVIGARAGAVERPDPTPRMNELEHRLEQRSENDKEWRASIEAELREIKGDVKLLLHERRDGK